MSKTNALRMYRKVGGKLVTHYSAAIVERAKSTGQGVLVASRGKEVFVPSKKLRLVYRPDLTGVFCETHERHGEGKYIANEAWKGDKSILGAQHVMPYLSQDYCYASIVMTLMKDLGIAAVKELRGVVKSSRELGEHIVWQGKRNADDCLVASPWRTRNEVWGMTCKMNAALSRRLKQAQSQRADVKDHLPPRRKFMDNINVMRRSRFVYNPVSAQSELQGGTYPYGMPLEQAGFAIDYCFLTDGFTIETDARGNKRVVETGNHYMRLVIGRTTPWVMTKADWSGCSTNDRFAFKSEKIRQAVIEARRRLDKTEKVA